MRRKCTERVLCDAIPRLTEEESTLCEGELTEEELRKAVISLENDKSPGIDGLNLKKW